MTFRVQAGALKKEMVVKIIKMAGESSERKA